MDKSYYSDVSDKELKLRDKLAIIRTVLANERTLLAYFRTALAVFIAGASLIKFFQSNILITIGWAMIPCSVLFTAVGIRQYKKMTERITLKSTGSKKKAKRNKEKKETPI